VSRLNFLKKSAHSGLVQCANELVHRLTILERNDSRHCTHLIYQLWTGEMRCGRSGTPYTPAPVQTRYPYQL
jgi:hypothetical protein